MWIVEIRTLESRDCRGNLLESLGLKQENSVKGL